MKKLDFNIPFSGFCSTTFINCFASVYMYLENSCGAAKDATFCNEWANGKCDGCGNCATKPHALQEKYFFLFDTMCGHSSLRCRWDGKPTDMERLINGDGEFYDGGSADNIEFLFGFAGYSYRTVTAPGAFVNEIAASVDRERPVIVKLRDNSVPFAVIIGYDGERLICPDFRAAQKSPEPAVTYEGISEIYIPGEKTAQRFTLIDGLKRIVRVAEYCLHEGMWDGYMKKIGTYGPDSLGEDKPEGRKLRMNRLAETMWHTFNCHNFAEVFRVYLGDKKFEHVYDGVGDVKRLGAPGLNEILNTVSWRYAYTHDLAWSLIGLDECIKWEDWKSHYYGDMIEVVIAKLKENDLAVLECINKLITALETPPEVIFSK